MALDGAEPEVKASMLVAEAARPEEKVDGAPGEEELVGVVVDVLPRKVPSAVCDWLASFVLASPILDVDAVSDVHVTSSGAGVIHVAHQCAQQAVKQQKLY